MKVNIPGVGEVNFPDSMGREDIERATAKLHRDAQRPKQPSAGVVFGERAVRTFADNILGLPAAVSEFLTSGAPKEPQQFKFPGTPLLAAMQLVGRGNISVPRVTTGDVASGIRAVPRAIMQQEGLDEAFSAEQERQAQADAAFSESSPVAAGLGEIAGDAATLLTARAPAAPALRRFTTPTPRVPTAPVGTVKRGFQEFVSLPRFQSVERGLRRAAETGVEGAFIAALNDNDPASAALASAGAQSAGSLALWLSSKPLTRLAPTVLGTTIAVQMLRQATPGVQQNIFESLDISINKTLLILGTGLFAGLSGLGRLPRGVTDNFGLVANSLTPAMRTPLLKVLGDLTAEREQGNDRTLRVLEEFSQNPDAFGKEAQRRIERAFKEGKSMSQTIEDLMKSREFRKRFEGLE
jgi:hypothetical protein